MSGARHPVFVAIVMGTVSSYHNMATSQDTTGLRNVN